MKYKLAIFDFDGTLADSFPFFLSTVNELADAHQFRKVDIADIDTLRGYDAKRLINHLGLPLWKVPFVGKDYKNRMADKVNQISLFAGVEDMLQSLSSSGILVSLVTSNSFNNVSRVLNSAIMELMVHPQCGATLFGKRPKLKAILQKTGIHSSQAIYIGDELRDLQAANAENMDFGAVAWGYTRVDALAERSPAAIFYSVKQIVERVTQPQSV